jgi:hypothetical protein
MQARTVVPLPCATIAGIAGCSSGNQSGESICESICALV